MARSNLLVRVMTAAVLIPLAVMLVFKGSLPVVLAAMAAIVVLAQIELLGMLGIRSRAEMVVASVAAVVCFTAVAIPAVDTALVTVASFAVLSVFLMFTRELPSFSGALGIHALALLYVPFCFGFAGRLPQLDGGREIMLLWLVVNWATDTFAYAVGIPFGKHKMTRISPKKSWEGLFGGVAGGIFAGVLVSSFLDVGPVVMAAAMGATGSVAGQVGDLVESAIKRCAGVKDSGGLIPGHGGLLDRLDSLFFTAPLFYLFALLVRCGQ